MIRALLFCCWEPKYLCKTHTYLDHIGFRNIQKDLNSGIGESMWWPQVCSHNRFSGRFFVKHPFPFMWIWTLNEEHHILYVDFYVGKIIVKNFWQNQVLENRVTASITHHSLSNFVETILNDLHRIIMKSFRVVYSM